MSNELRFDVEFTRDQIETILENSSVSIIVVSGTYTYRPSLGENVWEMNAIADGYDENYNKLTTQPQGVCPRPCPPNI